MEKTARGLLEDLKRNMDDWCAERVDYETFRESQRRVWEAVRASQGPPQRRGVRSPNPDTSRLYGLSIRTAGNWRGR